jgi:hypothetical protein
VEGFSSINDSKIIGEDTAKRGRERMKTRILGNRVTVFIRDDGPMIHCGDSPSYRIVRIELTPEQVNAIELRHTHCHNGKDFYEEISKIILENP